MDQQRRRVLLTSVAPRPYVASHDASNQQRGSTEDDSLFQRLVVQVQASHGDADPCTGPILSFR